ncbi:MAG: hypothetical protein HY271_14910 [Deltaproteobacteria bacterium]|nr:hypothetical protein [Deltaproteobacteria bacterium]
MGSGCPAKLCSASGAIERSHATRENADLVLVGPGRGECRRSGWLEEALASASAILDADGVIYVVLPATRRRRAAALLRAQGLELVATVAHLPNVKTSRYLVPVTPLALRYALSRLISSYPRARRLARVLLELAGAGHVVGTILPAVALVVRRPAARPPFEWLLRFPESVTALGGDLAWRVVMVTSWRAQGGSTVLHLLAPGREQATLVVKVPGIPEDVVRIEQEESILRRLGPAARAAGARLPEARLAQLADGRPVLVQTAVTGRPLAAMIAERPGTLAAILEEVSAWLERWNRSTRRVEALDAAVLEREILRPAALVTPLVAAGEQYRSWLAARCASLAGAQVPFTARHNDLTMRNVLADGEAPLGIVDWETGEEKGLPNGDLAYTVVDAVAAAAGYASRVEAFAQSFLPEGEHARIVSRLFARSCRALEVCPALAEIAFHACWLRHAADELRVAEGPARGPFLEVVERLARQRDRVYAGMQG